jgi:phytol kinase
VLVALHDPLLVAASFLALFALVFVARAVPILWREDSARSAAPGVRRALHAAVGLWTAWVTPRFHHLGWALVPPLVFFALNASGKTGRLVPALDRAGDRGSTRGLWTFPLGVALTYALFWHGSEPGRAPIVAGCLGLALADPAAAWVGGRLGQRRLRPLRLQRTLEGSIAFFLVAALAVGWIAWQHAPGVPTVRLAVGCAAAGALVEALSPAGWDNAVIPLAIAAAYRVLS